MSDTDCHIIFVWCFLRKSSSMSMSKKHFAPGTDTISWTSATNTFPESIYQPAPARRFEDQLVVSTNVYINCPCGLMGCHAEYIEVQCWKLGWLFTPQKWAKNWDSGSPTFFHPKIRTMPTWQEKIKPIAWGLWLCHKKIPNESPTKMASKSWALMISFIHILGARIFVEWNLQDSASSKHLSNLLTARNWSKEFMRIMKNPMRLVLSALIQGHLVFASNCLIKDRVVCCSIVIVRSYKVVSWKYRSFVFSGLGLPLSIVELPLLA